MKYACLSVRDIWKSLVVWSDVRTATRLLRACKFVYSSVAGIDLIRCVIRNAIAKGELEQQAVQNLLVTSSRFGRSDIARSMVSAGLVPAWIVGNTYHRGDYVIYKTITYFCKKRHLSRIKDSPYSTAELWCVARKAPE
jgi:hypothetical protein